MASYFPKKHAAVRYSQMQLFNFSQMKLHSHVEQNFDSSNTSLYICCRLISAFLMLDNHNSTLKTTFFVNEVVSKSQKDV